MTRSDTAGRPRSRVLGPLGRRLLAAFVLVAVGAVGVLGLVAVLSVQQQSRDLVEQEQERLRQQIATALSDAYVAGRSSWRSADLTGVGALAAAGDTRVTVVDPQGTLVATVGGDSEHGTEVPAGEDGAPPPPAPAPEPAPAPAPEPAPAEPAEPRHQDGGGHVGEPQGRQGGSSGQPLAMTAIASVLGGEPDDPTSVPVVVGGHQVATAVLDLPDAASTAQWRARDAILRTVAVGAGLAVGLAVVAAVLVTRRLTRPLVALADAAGAVARRDPAAVTRLPPGPGELGELTRAFVEMEASLRRGEELRRALVADVAHELRTPVTILHGLTEELLDGVAEPSAPRLTSLHDEVLRLERVLADLAALSSADAGGLTLTIGRTPLGEVVQQSVELLQPQADEAGVSVDVTLRDDVAIRADRERLVQVVVNLLSNALKFTQPGGSVHLEVHRQDDEGVLAVTDTGPGLAEDELPHVFERFWRGRTARGRSGSGIGLTVVQDVVAAHGGRVEARNRPEGGAAFTVWMPAW